LINLPVRSAPAFETLRPFASIGQIDDLYNARYRSPQQKASPSPAEALAVPRYD
jgi:hypothetical protein